MMKKRCLSILFVLCMVIILLPTTVWAAEPNLPVAYMPNLINTNSSAWYDTVLNNNLQKRREWEDQKYEWMNPNNFLSMNDSEMMDLSNEIVKNCTDDYEKVKAIHDWVCDNVYYDWEASTEGFGFIVMHSDEEESQFLAMSTYERLLSYKRGVCHYYASTFSKLVRAQGIPCMTVSGFASHTSSIMNAKDANHDWNEVYVNNHWINVDTTWDSSNVYANGEYIPGGSSDKYFDISDADFAHDHKIIEYPDVQIYYIAQQIGIPGGSTELSTMQSFPDQIVTITVKPKPGYQLESLNVSAKNNEVPITRQNNENNQYSFTMPNSNVTVTASFSKISQLTGSNFRDILANDYYAPAVSWAVERKITFGTSATTFSPDATCTCGQIITFLWRANGSPECTRTVFIDGASPSDYYYNAVQWAVENNIVNAKEFFPNSPCTREMVVTYLWRLAGSPITSYVSSFSDVPTDADYAQAVAWAVKEGIASGIGNELFAPDQICTRGQIVTFLYRAYS